MKLIECRIDNFGCLHDFRMEFHEGLNIILEDNGFGKSTLAAFIRVMLYGFEGETKRMEDRERTRFKPWQGGSYGGRLIFETGGKEYVLYRQFGSRQKDDRFILRNRETNLDVRDFSTNIGEELFGIDGDSFMRSAFISQLDCMTRATDDIHSKIGNLSDDTDDMNNYEKVMQHLNDILNHMTPDRKTGALYKTREEITDLRSKIAGERFLEEEVEMAVSDRDNTLSMMRSEKKRHDNMAELQARVAASANREHYADICENVQDCAGQLEKVRGAGIGTEKEKLLVSLSQRFKAGFSAEEYRAVKKQAQSIPLLRERIVGKQLRTQESVRLTELSALFAGSVDPEADNREMREKWEGFLKSKEATAGIREEIAGLERQKASMPPAGKGSLTAAVICWIICALLLLVFLLRKGDTILLLLAAAAGLTALVCTVLHSSSGKQRKALLENLDSQLRLKRKQLQDRASDDASEEAAVERYLLSFGLNGQADKSGAFHAISNLIFEYTSLMQKSREADCTEERKALKASEDTVQRYLARYGARVENMESSAAEAAFDNLLEDYRSYEKLCEELHARRTEVEKAEREYQNACARKREFEERHDVTRMIELVPLENMPGLKDISDNLQKSDRNLEELSAKLERQNRELESLTERLDEKKDNIEKEAQKKESYSEGLRRYELLKKTREHLEAAKQGLTAKYSHSISAGFAKYMSSVLAEESSSYSVNADAVVSCQAEGLPRDTRFLSAGSRDLVGFCLRMAFVDAMYRGEKPFLLLDDPFVNLDREKVEAGLKLMEESAETYQIIYFTCHESRCV